MSRDIKQVRGTPRSAAMSLWRTYRRKPGNFLTERIWPWLIHYLRVAFLPRKPFRTYKNDGSGRPGVFEIPESCTFGIAGDWGTGTEAAYRVADRMKEHNPDFTIHLGDVYYSGTAMEFQRYFVNAWPKGRLRTFALNANHEMYSGGEGYFDIALPALNQETSYFCLENAHWRILGLDTGYYARSFPFLELLLSGCIRLHPAIQGWLKEVVFTNPTDRRPVILLTHHEWFSAFDTEYKRVGSNLAPYLDRVVVWLWAHEHRFAGYGPFSFDGAPKIRARCLGHGGMPIELGRAPKRSDRNLVFYDGRQSGLVDDDRIGYCGFAFLTLSGAELRLQYLDEMGTKLLEERWVSQPLSSPTGEVVFASSSLTLVSGRTIEGIIG